MARAACTAGCRRSRSPSGDAPSTSSTYARQVAEARSAPSRHEVVIDDERLLRGAAAPRVARGRADRAPVERAAVLRLEARARARHRRADRRGQRRTARRLRQVPARRLELAGGRRSTTRVAPARGAPASSRGASCRACPAALGRYAGRSFLAIAARRRRHVLRQLRRRPTGGASASCSRAPHSAARPRPARAYAAARWRLLRAPARGGRTLLDRAAVRRHEDVPGRAADEAGPDEHGASIESRVPFLDHELVEFAARLPDRWKLSGWTTKRILREAMRGAAAGRDPEPAEDGLPGAVRRAGRAAAGTRSPATCSCDRRARERGILDPRPVARLLDDHAAGRVEGGDQIWSLMNLELWYRTFIDGDGVQTLPAPGAPAPAAPRRRHPSRRRAA